MLNSMIRKITEKKGNWAFVVPKHLYFVRCSPCETTGLSLFMARQGWEPNTPIQLLYKSWAQSDLGKINLEEWVIDNAERVESMRERCVQGITETTEKRKAKWDCKANKREFSVREEVLLRKPEMNFKLEES